nr:hypothetical protein [uncultured Actinoplanes sp.]
MSYPETPRGGFAGDPAEALAVTGTSGCCGNPARSTLALPDPAGSGPVTCCGTPAEAAADKSCCGTTAKAQAVAAGRDCCG